MKVTVIPVIIGLLGTVPKSLIRKSWKSEDDPETIQFSWNFETAFWTEFTLEYEDFRVFVLIWRLQGIRKVLGETYKDYEGMTVLNPHFDLSYKKRQLEFVAEIQAIIDYDPGNFFRFIASDM